MLQNILHNNIYLSLIIGLLIAVAYYFENKRENQQQKIKSYLKLSCIAALCVFIALYIRTKSFDIPVIKMGGGGGPSPQLPQVNSLQNVNIGEPNF